MPDLTLYLVLFLFHVVALLGLNLALARFVPSRFARYRVTWRCNKYANHTAYILTVGDAVARWTYIHPDPSHNGKLPSDVG